MKNTAVLPFLVLLFVALACDRWLDENMRVLDQEENPVANAKIIWKQGDRKVGETYTDANGVSHIFESVCPGPPCYSKFYVEVSKDGFQTEKEEFVPGKAYNGPAGMLVVRLKRSK